MTIPAQDKSTPTLQQIAEQIVTVMGRIESNWPASRVAADVRGRLSKCVGDLRALSVSVVSPSTSEARDTLAQTVPQEVINEAQAALARLQESATTPSLAHDAKYVAAALSSFDAGPVDWTPPPPNGEPPTLERVAQRIRGIQRRVNVSYPMSIVTDWLEEALDDVRALAAVPASTPALQQIIERLEHKWGDPEHYISASEMVTLLNDTLRDLRALYASVVSPSMSEGRDIDHAFSEGVKYGEWRALASVVVLCGACGKTYTKGSGHLYCDGGASPVQPIPAPKLDAVPASTPAHGEETEQASANCFACGKEITRLPAPSAHTRDGQVVNLGPDCFRHVEESGEEGWQPPSGGPRLYSSAAAYLESVRRGESPYDIKVEDAARFALAARSAVPSGGEGRDAPTTESLKRRVYDSFVRSHKLGHLYPPAEPTPPSISPTSPDVLAEVVREVEALQPSSTDAVYRLAFEQCRDAVLSLLRRAQGETSEQRR